MVCVPIIRTWRALLRLVVCSSTPQLQLRPVSAPCRRPHRGGRGRKRLIKLHAKEGWFFYQQRKRTWYNHIQLQTRIQMKVPVTRAWCAAVPCTFRRENRTRYFSGSPVLGSFSLLSSPWTTWSDTSTRVAIFAKDQKQDANLDAVARPLISAMYAPLVAYSARALRWGVQGSTEQHLGMVFVDFRLRHPRSPG